MKLIIEAEWQKEHARARAVGDQRDPEPDAEHADDADEKVYE
jgi:hypothetical protein